MYYVHIILCIESDKHTCPHLPTFSHAMRESDDTQWERITLQNIYTRKKPTKATVKNAHMWHTRKINIQQELRNEDEPNKGKTKIMSTKNCRLLCAMCVCVCVAQKSAKHISTLYFYMCANVFYAIVIKVHTHLVQNRVYTLSHMVSVRNSLCECPKA